MVRITRLKKWDVTLTSRVNESAKSKRRHCVNSAILPAAVHSEITSSVEGDFREFIETHIANGHHVIYRIFTLRRYADLMENMAWCAFFVALRRVHTSSYVNGHARSTAFNEYTILCIDAPGICLPNTASSNRNTCPNAHRHANFRRDINPPAFIYSGYYG